jgi:hypothetical protein
MYVAIIDQKGAIVKKDIKSVPEVFLHIIKPFPEDTVAAVKKMFAWYWLSDL